MNQKTIMMKKLASLLFIISALQFTFAQTFQGKINNVAENGLHQVFIYDIPEDKKSFSIQTAREIIEKIALIVGSFVFAQVLYLTQSMQYSALSLGIFFIISIVLLRFIKKD